MTGGADTHRTPLASWSRPVVVVLAYRPSMGKQPRATVAERAAHDIPLMISAAARDHSEWFWRPSRERIAHEERSWKGRVICPRIE